MDHQEVNRNEIDPSQQVPEQMPEAPKMLFQGYENVGFVMPVCKS